MWLLFCVTTALLLISHRHLSTEALRARKYTQSRRSGSLNRLLTGGGQKCQHSQLSPLVGHYRASQLSMTLNDDNPRKYESRRKQGESRPDDDNKYQKQERQKRYAAKFSATEAQQRPPSSSSNSASLKREAFNITIPRYQQDLQREAELAELTATILNKDLLDHTIAAWKAPMPPEYVDRPLVLAGPSGVGKGRLVKALMKDWTKYFGKVVTHTTRKPRFDEVNGTHYHFTSLERFEALKAQDYFLETAVVHNNHYGMSRDAFMKIKNQRKISIMEIDIQGTKSIKKIASALNLQPKYVFISPKHISFLEERLHLRGTETQEDIDLRVKNAEKELVLAEEEGLFDTVLVNDDFELTANAFFRLCRDTYKRLPSPAKMRMLQRRVAKVKRLLANRDEIMINKEREGEMSEEDEEKAVEAEMLREFVDDK